jgi:hypothetical protein
MNARIKAFGAAYKAAMNQQVHIGDIRRIGLQFGVDDDRLLMALNCQQSGMAAEILGVDVDELDKEIDRVKRMELN